MSRDRDGASGSSARTDSGSRRSDARVWLLPGIAAIGAGAAIAFATGHDALQVQAKTNEALRSPDTSMQAKIKAERAEERADLVDLPGLAIGDSLAATGAGAVGMGVAGIWTARDRRQPAERLNRTDAPGAGPEPGPTDSGGAVPG